MSKATPMSRAQRWWWGRGGSASKHLKMGPLLEVAIVSHKAWPALCDSSNGKLKDNESALHPIGFLCCISSFIRMPMLRRPRSSSRSKEENCEHAGLHGQPQQMSNSSSISHFLLLALADTRQLQLLHFCLLLGISLAALLGNGLIISTVACGHHLHTPMFFFLLNLALSDLGSICTTVPKAMHNSLWDTRNISYTGCVAQVFFFLFFISTEYYLLTIMCYDRYVSICKPLHYGTLLGSRACAHMAAAAWACGFLHALMHTANTFFCPWAMAMPWASSSVKSPRSSGSPAPNPTSGNFGILLLVCVQLPAVLCSWFSPMCRSSGLC
ncbi:olfactory receptor 14C36-like isoform X2 [Passer domesticus]|uniref:olfactory receptor 14C36-like isoform X2 n=1 Tax=Passer domesticus TaxID=48849 RepID=UPI0030FE56DD